MSSKQRKLENSPEFELTSDIENIGGTEDFQLESDAPLPDTESVLHQQAELFLPEHELEPKDDGVQFELDGMHKPTYLITLNDGRHARFHNARTLLESLEANGIDIQYQCREGYCGSCRVELLEGSVHYYEEPMAFLDDDEILPCCCVPKSPLTLKVH